MRVAWLLRLRASGICHPGRLVAVVGHDLGIVRARVPDSPMELLLEILTAQLGDALGQIRERRASFGQHHIVGRVQEQWQRQS